MMLIYTLSTTFSVPWVLFAIYLQCYCLSAYGNQSTAENLAYPIGLKLTAVQSSFILGPLPWRAGSRFVQVTRSHRLRTIVAVTGVDQLNLLMVPFLFREWTKQSYSGHFVALGHTRVAAFEASFTWNVD